MQRDCPRSTVTDLPEARMQFQLDNTSNKILFPTATEFLRTYFTLKRMMTLNTTARMIYTTPGNGSLDHGLKQALSFIVALN